MPTEQPAELPFNPGVEPEGRGPLPPLVKWILFAVPAVGTLLAMGAVDKSSGVAFILLGVGIVAGGALCSIRISRSRVGDDLFPKVWRLTWSLRVALVLGIVFLLGKYLFELLVGLILLRGFPGSC